MSFLSQFIGGGATKLIVNGAAVAGFNFTSAFALGPNSRVVYSGAMTAGALKTILSIAGPGEMDLLALASVDSTSRTARVKITIDGLVAFDYTSAAVAYGGSTVALVGTANSATLEPGLPIRWTASLLIELASSLTETDKFQLGYRYHLEQ